MLYDENGNLNREAVDAFVDGGLRCLGRPHGCSSPLPSGDTHNRALSTLHAAVCDPPCWVTPCPPGVGHHPTQHHRLLPFAPVLPAGMAYMPPPAGEDDDDPPEWPVETLQFFSYAINNKRNPTNDELEEMELPRAAAAYALLAVSAAAASRRAPAVQVLQHESSVLLGLPWRLLCMQFCARPAAPPACHPSAPLQLECAPLQQLAWRENAPFSTALLPPPALPSLTAGGEAGGRDPARLQHRPLPGGVQATV